MKLSKLLSKFVRKYFVNSFLFLKNDGTYFIPLSSNFDISSRLISGLSIESKRKTLSEILDIGKFDIISNGLYCVFDAAEKNSYFLSYYYYRYGYYY